MKERGHYCRVCETYNANEKFTGKGHKIHVCQKCAQLLKAERKAKRKQAEGTLQNPTDIKVQTISMAGDIEQSNEE